jgi:enoyl-[acyl-carrier protein] reductase III
MDLGLRGRRAVVTGAGRGIGRAIAFALADAGVHVAFNYLRNRRAAEETLEKLHSRGVEAFAMKANVADETALSGMFTEVRERFGGLDLLVANAASGVERPAMEITERHFRWTMDINAWGYLSAAQQAVPLMENGGSIVAISSLGSVRALPYYTAVGASKAAIESLTRHLAAELGPRGIRVNALCPGVVDTDALGFFPNRRELLAEAKSRTPLGRMLTPEDVASTVLFLASDLSTMVSGCTIVVDGGAHVLG